ncbi:MAG: hypothetical protein Q9208_000020 [Pyrenodesmia sp. 3 TL-2023]
MSDPALLDVADALERLIAFGPTVGLHVGSASSKNGKRFTASSTDYTRLVLKSYEAIEKVLVAILAFLKLEADGVRDAEGHHTFHIDTLSTFDRSNFPLPGLLQAVVTDKAEKPFADDTSVHAMIDTLRRLRNKVSSAGKEGLEIPADSIVRIALGCSYICWCWRIFSALLGAFVICIDLERTCRQTGARIVNIQPWSKEKVKRVMRICTLSLDRNPTCSRHGGSLKKSLMAKEVEDRKQVRAMLQSVQVKSRGPAPRRSTQPQRRSGRPLNHMIISEQAQQCWAFIVVIGGKHYTSQTAPQEGGDSGKVPGGTI